MMNDEMEQFERRASRQPLRQLPANWRREILATANESAYPATNAARPGFLSTLNHQLSTVFWPHPKAWAGLAAVWVLILTMNFSMRDKAPVVAEKVAPPSPEVLVELQKQKQLFAELIGSNEARVADRQKLFLPRPRSELAEILMT